MKYHTWIISNRRVIEYQLPAILTLSGVTRERGTDFRFDHFTFQYKLCKVKQMHSKQLLRSVLLILVFKIHFKGGMVSRYHLCTLAEEANTEYSLIIPPVKLLTTCYLYGALQDRWCQAWTHLEQITLSQVKSACRILDYTRFNV